MSDAEEERQPSASSASGKNHKKYRRDKPWDTPDIDHWAIQPWNEEDDAKVKPFVEESSFATLFPKYREKYLREVWSMVTKSLEVKTSFRALAFLLRLIFFEFISKNRNKELPVN